LFYLFTIIFFLHTEIESPSEKPFSVKKQFAPQSFLSQAGADPGIFKRRGGGPTLSKNFTPIFFSPQLEMQKEKKNTKQTNRKNLKFLGGGGGEIKRMFGAQSL
jgi:hypothetical protein